MGSEDPGVPASVAGCHFSRRTRTSDTDSLLLLGDGVVATSHVHMQNVVTGGHMPACTGSLLKGLVAHALDRHMGLTSDPLLDNLASFFLLCIGKLLYIYVSTFLVLLMHPYG